MPSVKLPILAIAIIAVAAGCTKLELARFAPPGIIKYEDLAGDQPVNPAIQERIATRKVEKDAAFPVIARTPGEGDRPQMPATAARTAETQELVALRAAQESAVDADREAVEAEKATGALLPERRDALKEQADLDAAAAAKQAQENLKLPGDATPD